MWKYKNPIITGLLFNVFTILYYIGEIYTKSAAEVIHRRGIQLLLEDENYMLVLFGLIFLIFQVLMSDGLVFYRFSTVKQYLHYQILDMAKRLAVFIAISTIAVFAIIAISSTHNLFMQLGLICLRFIMLYIILLTAYVLIITSFHKNLRLNTGIILSVLYILTLEVQIYGVNNVMSVLNPMSLFYGLDMLSYIRFGIILLMIITWIKYRVQAKGVSILLEG